MWNIPRICGNCFSLGGSAFSEFKKRLTGPVLYKNLALQNNQMGLKYSGRCLGIFLGYMVIVSALVSLLKQDFQNLAYIIKISRKPVQLDLFQMTICELKITR